MQPLELVLAAFLTVVLAIISPPVAIAYVASLAILIGRGVR